ncbi:MAG: TMEM43 family protein [Cyanobacteriota bacterium]
MSNEQRRILGEDTVEVTETISPEGYFSRVKNAFGGILFGFLLFIAAFIVLFWNEWRADIGAIAETAVEIKADAAASSEHENMLVSLTGPLTTEENISDDMFLKEGNFLGLKRKVEMYAWVEDADTQQNKNKNGTTTKKTTYRYSKKWVLNPAKTGSFNKPEGHENPPEKTIPDTEVKSSQAKIGLYNIDLNKTGVPGYKKIDLTNEVLKTEMLAPSTPVPPQTQTIQGNMLTTTIPKPVNYNNPVLTGGYLFQGTGTLVNPNVGDMRISFESSTPGVTVTMIGKLNGDTIDEFKDEHNNKVFSLTIGSKEQAVEGMKAAHQAWTWGLRVAGFFMMVIGLNMIFAPISAVLSFLPFIGNFSKSLIGTIILVVSIVLSLLTIGISLLIQNIVLLILLCVMIFLLVVGVFVTALIMIKKYSKQT